ncbi:MAG TPA: response regulator receiver protein [Verrucomicrobiales bacterium]|nr:response regulator receiver protein [Verrucomicrobiales bacterium]
MSKRRILIIEDDDLQYEIYADALENFELDRARTATQGFAIASKSPPDLILLDHVLDKGELGLNFLPELKELLPFVPVIVVSGALEVHQQIKALQGPRRAHWCLTKPVDIHELTQTVETALKECGEQEIVRQFEALERSKRIDKDELLSRSSDRLSRQTTIRKQLSGSTDRPNISALSRQFNVARRTIIRDLQELIRRGELPPEIYPEGEIANVEEA